MFQKAAEEKYFKRIVAIMFQKFGAVIFLIREAVDADVRVLYSRWREFKKILNLDDTVHNVRMLRYIYKLMFIFNFYRW